MSTSFRVQGVELLARARRLGASIHLLRQWQPIADLICSSASATSPLAAQVRLHHKAFGHHVVFMSLEAKFAIAGEQDYVPAFEEEFPEQTVRSIGAKELCKRFSLHAMIEAVAALERFVADNERQMRKALEQASIVSGEETARAA